MISDILTTYKHCVTFAEMGVWESGNGSERAEGEGKYAHFYYLISSWQSQTWRDEDWDCDDK